MSVDMQTFLESAQKDAFGVRVRCGEQRNPRTIGNVLVGDCPLDPARYSNFDATEVDSWEECFDAVEEMLDGVGWGIEPGEECARLHLIGENGNQLRTWSRTQWPDAVKEPDTNAAMAAELIRMCAEVRKMSAATIESQAETIQALSATNMTLREDAIESYRAEIEAIAESSLVSTIAEIEAEVDHPGDPLRDTAAQVMQGLAAQFLPVANGVPSNPKELIMNALRADPSLLAELVSDPDLVAMAGELENGSAVPSPTPNPKDE